MKMVQTILQQNSCPIQNSGASIANSPICNGLLLFMSILESYIISRSDISEPCTRIVGGLLGEGYDFVVVGGGAAGSVVAGRLAENPAFKVLLLEAGGPDPVVSRVPSFYRNFWYNAEVDWRYRTQPSSDYCLSEEGKGCKWPRGKVLGGSGVLNGMMYHRGHPADFQDWADFGVEGWSWEQNLPFYMMSENNKQVGTVVSGRLHGVKGPMPVQRFRYTPEVVYDFLHAINESGLPVIDDMVDPETPDGVTIAQTFTDNGQRYTTARAFLKRNRANLDVVLHAHVTRVLFEDGTAYGVEFIHEGGKKTVRANKEVILSAGALNSPHILLHSGIGPRDMLKNFNIPVVANLPVGQNMRNHYGITLYFTMENLLNTQKLDWTATLKYLLNREGPMSATGITQMTAISYSSLADRSRKQPDLQFFFNGFYAECSETGLIGEPAGDNPYKGRNFTVNAVSTRPRSIGYLTLQSSNPLVPPVFNPRYFSHPDDMVMLKDAARYVKTFVSTEPLQKKYGIKLDESYTGVCKKFNEWSDRWLECMARVYTDPQNHQQGTAAISRVTDSQLRVYNVSRLRVIDASVMPTQITGNPQATIMMVAERGVCMILASWGHNTAHCPSISNYQPVNYYNILLN